MMVNTTSQRTQQHPQRWQFNTWQLAVGVLFSLLFLLACRIPTDTDTWWHLRSAQYMLEQRTILQSDPFSFTRQGQPWVNHSWLAQLILYGFYQLFGGTAVPNASGSLGLAVYTALLSTSALALVYRMSEGNPFVRGIVLIVAAAAAAVFWSARPQMFSFLLAAVLLYVLHLYKRRKVDRLWVLPLLMVLWVNLHGGFAIGFIILLGTLAGEVLGRLLDTDNPDGLTWQQIGKLALVTIIGAVALVVNPNTVQMWGYPFRTFGIGALQDFIQEWQSPNFHGRHFWPFAALILGSMVALGLSRRRADWTDLVLLCGFTFMSLYAARNISTLALIAAPVICRHLEAWLTEHGWRLRPPRPPKRAGTFLNYALLGLVVLGVAAVIGAQFTPANVLKEQTTALPIQAAAFLNEHINPATAGAMFNNYNWGGYLMFAAPRFPIFVDGRTDLFDSQLLLAWYNAYQGRDWQPLFAEYNIQLAVLEQGSGLALALRQDPRWVLRYEDPQAQIFQQQADLPAPTQGRF